ncbi:unnamed protein product [Anisakis simplex]|uniref:Glycine N-acyltransferase-like protein n=1 Tax=Anisakis simplex TaxID=6269 RepID=A0A0M3K5I0_ANISI|nr:unnamed protein product [Anisakis simplex]
MPSALVRHGKEAVSFEMCDPSGFQNHLFTIEQHRGKGLGTAVEMRLCQQCISEQLWPFKCVELYNTSVLKSANESHLWTRLDDLSHNPIAINFIRFSKKNGPSAPAT